MKPLLPFSAFLFFLLCTFWACDKEDLDWNRQKISFTQIENDPVPVETTEEIILSATIRDIEDPELTPTPEPLVEWGHIFSTNEAAISSLAEKGADLRSLNPDISFVRGQSLFSPNNTHAEQRFNTIIRVDAIRNLQTGIPYFYRAYVKRPHDGTYCLSPFSPDEFFEIPKVKIETIFPEDSIVRTEMQIKVLGKISDAKDLEIVEFGHRLFEGNNPEHIDQFFSTDLISGKLTGEYTYFHELPFFDVNKTYKVKAYIKYRESGNPEEEEIDDVGQEFRFDETGFWINTATIRKRSDPTPDLSPLALENTVSFVLTDDGGAEFAYVGLGDSGAPDYIPNQKFWKFDPRFYTWEEVPFPFPAELKNPVFFTHDNTAYIGLGEKADGSGYNLAFWQTKFDSEWDEVDDMEISDFSAQLQSTYTGNGASIDPLILPSLMYRSSAFNASGIGTPPFFGGGKGPGFNRLTNIPVNYEKENADERLWYDFNDNHEVDWGQWVDVNGDGLINAGIQKHRDVEGENNTTVREYWLELENAMQGYGSRDLMPNSDGKYFMKVSTNNNNNTFELVEVIPGNDLINDELFNQEYSLNPTIRRCEWNNHSTGGPPDDDKRIDDGQIELVEVIKNDLWVRENTSWTIHTKPDFQRYGAITFNNGTNYIIGGVTEDSDYGQSIALNGDFEPTEVALETINSAYGIAFTINGISYFGGGEDVSGNIPSLNVRMFEPPAGIRPTVGCGLPALTRGIAFAANGKGFIGIGRERSDKLTKALWMYIPF